MYTYLARSSGSTSCQRKSNCVNWMRPFAQRATGPLTTVFQDHVIGPGSAMDESDAQSGPYAIRSDEYRLCGQFLGADHRLTRFEGAPNDPTNSPNEPRSFSKDDCLPSVWNTSRFLPLIYIAPQSSPHTRSEEPSICSRFVHADFRNEPGNC
jgi:hypothetical protein